MVRLNCEMEFKCSQKWDEMSATVDANIRHCSACKKKVHFCHTVEDLDRAVNKHRCVAFISGEIITNDNILREFVLNIEERKKKGLNRNRAISITTGIPNYRGGKAFLELDGED